MTKAQALSAILRLWKEQPESDRTLENFHTFYDALEDDHPDLLKWPLTEELGGVRDKEVMSYLSRLNVIR